MNVLPRDKQIQVIAGLVEGVSIRAMERMTGIHRDTIMRLAAKVGAGCEELHDRMMVGIRTPRLELDELWAFVGKKQRHLTRTDGPQKGRPIYVRCPGLYLSRHRRLSHRQARHGHHARVYGGPS